MTYLVTMFSQLPAWIQTALSVIVFLGLPIGWAVRTHMRVDGHGGRIDALEKKGNDMAGKLDKVASDIGDIKIGVAEIRTHLKGGID